MPLQPTEFDVSGHKLRSFPHTTEGMESLLAEIVETTDDKDIRDLARIVHQMLIALIDNGTIKVTGKEETSNDAP